MEATARCAGEGELIPAGPTTSRVLVGGADSGGRLSVIEMQVGAGFAGPRPPLIGAPQVV